MKHAINKRSWPKPSIFLVCQGGLDWIDNLYSVDQTSIPNRSGLDRSGIKTFVPAIAFASAPVCFVPLMVVVILFHLNEDYWIQTFLNAKCSLLEFIMMRSRVDIPIIPYKNCGVLSPVELPLRRCVVLRSEHHLVHSLKLNIAGTWYFNFNVQSSSTNIEIWCIKLKKQNGNNRIVMD